ncbi:hypothetical protein GCM10017687_09680 [Streptomyces echinatus]
MYGRRFTVRRSKAADRGVNSVETTSLGVAVYLVLLFAPGLTSVLESIAYRFRAAGKAELVRAERERDGRKLSAREGRQERHG